MLVPPHREQSNPALSPLMVSLSNQMSGIESRPPLTPFGRLRVSSPLSAAVRATLGSSE